MNNIARIQEKLIENDLDALLIFGEKNQRFAAGFPFTDGAVVVGREKAWLLTDSRYIEAAEKAAGDCADVQLFDRERPLMSLIRAALAEAKAEKSSALAYRYALKRYDAGMATLYDLSQVRQQWFTASENALRMKYEYLIRKRILEIQASLSGR